MAGVQTLEAPRTMARASGGRFALALPQVWVAAVLALPVIRVAGGLGTLDLAYHMRAGELMLAARHVLHSDPFTYTAAGPWVDQQWGAQVVFATIYRSLGWPGLVAGFAVLLSAAFGFLFLACRSAGASPSRAASFTLAGFALGASSLALRPQLFGVVLFTATLWLVAGRRAHPRRLWWVPLLVVLWANLHGTFFLAPLLLGLAWIADEVEGNRSANTTLAVGAASLAATLVNPFGLRVWAYALSISTNGQISRLLTEWQPPNVRHVDDLIFFVSVAAVVAVLARRSRPVPWTLLLPLGVFFAVALTATRNVLWWALAVPPILAAVLAEPERGGDEAGIEALCSADPPRGAAGERSFLNTAIAGGMAMVAVTFVALSLDGAGMRTPPSQTIDAPPALTGALLEIAQPGERLFAAQRWSSWLELVAPRNPVFVDARIEVFPAEVWDDYLDVSNGREGWQSILGRWGADLVVAQRVQQAGLLPLIDADPGWIRVYEDRDGAIYRRAPG